MVDTSHPPGPLRALRVVAAWALPPVVSAALLVDLARRGWSLSSLREASPGPLALGAAISVAINVALSATRLRATARACGVALPARDALTLWAGALPWTFYAPLSSGAVLQAVALSRRAGLALGRATGVVLVDKLLSLAGMTAVVALGAALHPTAPAPLRALGAAVALLAQMSEPTLALCAAWAMHLDLSPRAVWGEFSVAMLASHVPWSVNGAGVRAALVHWITPGAVDRARLVCTAELTTALEFVVPALAGVPWARAAWRARPEKTP